MQIVLKMFTLTKKKCHQRTKKQKYIESILKHLTNTVINITKIHMKHFRVFQHKEVCFI